MSSGDDETTREQSSADIIKELQTAGFFEQIRDLDSNIKRIVTDLETLGTLATERVRETENLAAHVLAVEAILAVILRTHPIDPQAVRAAIRDMTADLSGDPEGSQVVRTVVESLLSPSKE